MNEKVSTGVVMPKEVMDLLDKQAKAARRNRSAQLVWLVEQEENRQRAQFAPRTKTRQPMGV